MTTNRKKCQQAHIPPLLQPLLCNGFGLVGVGPTANAVLDGTYQPPAGIDKAARHLLAFFAKNVSAESALEHPHVLHQNTDERLETSEGNHTSSGGNLHFSMRKAGTQQRLIVEIDVAIQTFQ